MTSKSSIFFQIVSNQTVGDGYPEHTYWVQTNQAMLVIDINRAGLIGPGELVNLNDRDALNSLRRLGPCDRFATLLRRPSANQCEFVRYA